MVVVDLAHFSRIQERWLDDRRDLVRLAAVAEERDVAVPEERSLGGHEFADELVVAGGCSRNARGSGCRSGERSP